MILEGTPEFNRGFSAVVRDLTDTPLDGQTYQPAPWIVEDTQIGFDLDGNYHCVPTPNTEVPALGVEERRRITKLSHHLIQTIIQEMPEQYGTVDRADAVWRQLAKIEEHNGLEPMQFNSVFDIFVRNYNGDVH